MFDDFFFPVSIVSKVVPEYGRNTGKEKETGKKEKQGQGMEVKQWHR